MKKSAMYSKYENGDAFDAHLDFSMFLEEARKHAREGRAEASTGGPSSDSAQKWGVEDEKKKKSWKNSLFFWRKSEKKIKPEHETLPADSLSSQCSRPKPRSALSGPIHGSSGGRTCPINRSGGRPTSGPLSGFLTPTRRGDEFEIPYMWLDQQNNPSRSQAFGPIYLVT